MMFFKVIIFITICAVDSRILLPQLKREQEIPVLRFNKHVVFPMMYKYAELNQYTPNTIVRSGRSVQPNLYQGLQYAPLYDGLRWNHLKEKADEINTQQRPTPTAPSGPMLSTEFIRDDKFVHLYRKSHLEPRPDATDTKCYAPGNKAPTSVSRSPGHNVVYKIFPESIPTEQHRKPLVDYVKPIGINLKLESLTSTTEPSYPSSLNLPRENVGGHLELSKQQFVINPIEHFVLNPKTIKNKRYLAHTKYHRLHLNIARVYNPGQLPQQRAPSQLPLPVRVKNLIRRRGSKYAQAYVPQAYKDLSLAHNTILYPHHRKTFI